MSQAQREEQMAQAEELLGAPAEERGFAKGLYFGQHLSRILPEYPWEMSTDRKSVGRERVYSDV